jgi:hypothetical protein
MIRARHQVKGEGYGAARCSKRTAKAMARSTVRTFDTNVFGAQGGATQSSQAH